MEKIIHKNTPFGALEVITLDELKSIINSKQEAFISIYDSKKPFNRRYLKVVNYDENSVIVKNGEKYLFQMTEGCGGDEVRCIGFYFKKA